MFEVSAQERTNGALSAANLMAIQQTIGSRGFAVVTGLVTQETCDMLLASTLEDAARLAALGKLSPHEVLTGKGHMQLGLRRSAPYVRSDLVANPLVEHVVAAVLGQGAWFGFYSGNVNLPGSVYQPLHFDRPFTWRTEAAATQAGQPWPPPATTLSCSVALTSITKTNGATEIYPGTHRETAVTQWPANERISNHPDLIQRWSPPQQMEIPAGGICFRDPRMWHRGVPNTSAQARPMVALTYHAQQCRHWRGRLAKPLTPEQLSQLEQRPELRVLDDGELGDSRLVFEENAAEVFDQFPSQHGIDRNVRFVSAPKQVNHFLDAHLLGGARIVPAGPIAAEA